MDGIQRERVRKRERERAGRTRREDLVGKAVARDFRTAKTTGPVVLLEDGHVRVTETSEERGAAEAK